jgi:hypothetical protein
MRVFLVVPTPLSPTLITEAVPFTEPFFPNLFLPKNMDATVNSGCVERMGLSGGLRKGVPSPFQPYSRTSSLMGGQNRWEVGEVGGRDGNILGRGAVKYI